MDASMRHAPALNERIDKMQSESLKRFQNLISLAKVNNTDRTVTAGIQLQMATETTALIRSFEEIQTVIRELQVLWLQGPLDTLGDSRAKRVMDENAKAVAEMVGVLVGVRRDGQQQQEQREQGRAAEVG
ncbi:hypothetical protein DOTSEDRAFT_23812 [Dothistroma septosporum NZE10]|uniref:Mediator of RNA polymerase II transcription subunit 22 n=1 Tax=Dothistroma septosporum (strain NZE10 / CBS 128990) TaxID=675120 RepID=N1PTU9_DOTSN|nr:hypothetical protein DOTSEDRAFT_23812 [Dothistroma septosporum NZE10]